MCYSVTDLHVNINFTVTAILFTFHIVLFFSDTYNIDTVMYLLFCYVCHCHCNSYTVAATALIALIFIFVFSVLIKKLHF